MIHLKCTDVHYANLNSSSINKPYCKLFRFFQFLIYVYFSEIFVKKLSFLNINFQTSFQEVVYYRILGCQTLRYENSRPLNIRQNLGKKPFLFRSKIDIFDIFLKRLYEDLQINSNWKFQTHATMSHKMIAL